MARATETLDLSEVLATLESWRRVARLTVVAGPNTHRAMYSRAAARLAAEQIRADEPLPRITGPAGPVAALYTVTTDDQSQQQVDTLPAEVNRRGPDGCLSRHHAR